MEFGTQWQNSGDEPLQKQKAQPRVSQQKHCWQPRALLPENWEEQRGEMGAEPELLGWKLCQTSLAFHRAAVGGRADVRFSVFFWGDNDNS